MKKCKKAKNIKNIDRVLKYKKALNFGKVFQGRNGTRRVSFAGLILTILIIFLIFQKVVLAFSWDVSTASYDSEFFDVTNETWYPSGLFFKPDGTKMYIAAAWSGLIYQYSLSTPWDILTSGYDSKSLDTTAQDDPQDLFFNTDGTKVYVMGELDATIYQYSLSTPWDISTGNYDSKSFDVSNEDLASYGLFFKPDGSKVYTAGASSDTIYQYSLLTPWDISTGSYDSKSFNVVSEDTPVGVFFKADGTKMYIAGTGNSRIHQYTLSTPWDVSTAIYDNKSLDTIAQDYPEDLSFNTDGTKVYMVGAGDIDPEIPRVYQYSMIVPDQVTGVSATDGTYTDKVTVAWDAANGTDKYYVWEGSSWVDVGDVLTWDHTGAPAPTIIPGTASASDGTSTAHVALSLSGQSTNNGSSTSYKVKAWNTGGYGPESASNSGYRGVGTLAYQWQRSAGDSDDNYSNIDGATTTTFNDTGAPENGDGRYYKCVENADGASQATSSSDRGYRITAPTVTISTATNVEEATATINGDVTDTGGENPTTTMYWGETDGEQTPSSWNASSTPTSPSQPQGAVAFYKNLTSLDPGTKYYFSAKATNSVGTDWPSSSLNFATKPDPPTSPASSSVEETTAHLGWTAPVSGGLDGYYCRYKTGSYPTSYTDGSECSVSGTGSDLTGLSPGTEYYYRIWSYKTGSPNAGGVCDTPIEGTFTTGLIPTAPTALYSNDTNAQTGEQNPTGIADRTPVFSAVYNDPDSEDIADKYRVQVAVSSDFATSSRVWDSGSSGTSMSNCAEGDRCQDVEYAGTWLGLDGSKYYWRINFWSGGAEGDWSTTTAHFTMTSRQLDASTNANTLRLGADRHTFYDGTDYWAFYIDDNSHIVYEKSSNGLTWSETVVEVATSTTYSSLGIWEDDTYIWTSYNSTTTSYTRKITISNGTLGTEYSTSTADRYHPQIIKDSQGYLWKGYSWRKEE